MTSRLPTAETSTTYPLCHQTLTLQSSTGSRLRRFAKRGQGEKEILEEHCIKAFSTHEVHRYVISNVVERVLDYVNPQRDCHNHLSFNVDALDRSVAPSSGTLVRGELTFCDGHSICKATHETGSSSPLT
ncbi:hypothetical protein EDB19DRAFT_490471 [Suillus lakei]|nr:hypothetical protein EDB19DRAFT_490471 [Suillus lakei]